MLNKTSEVETQASSHCFPSSCPSVASSLPHLFAKHSATKICTLHLPPSYLVLQGVMRPTMNAIDHP